MAVGRRVLADEANEVVAVVDGVTVVAVGGDKRHNQKIGEKTFGYHKRQ